MKGQDITVCAFIHQDGKALIAKRAATKSFLPNKFELLGGHVEFGETPEEVLKRELMEELELKIIVGNPYHAFAYLTNEGTRQSVEIDYVARFADPNQEIKTKPDEHSEVRWIGRDEVDSYFAPDDDEKIAVIKGFEVISKSQGN